MEKNNYINTILAFLLGIAVMFIINLLLAPNVDEYKAWEAREEVKRQVLYDSIEMLERSYKRQVQISDSIQLAADNTLKVERSRYIISINKAKDKRNEELNYINTIDDAYLNILSRE